MTLLKLLEEKHITYTINDLHTEFFTIKKDVPTYRFGQHFINKFIKDSSGSQMQHLWNLEDYISATSMVNDIISDNQWDYNDLPVINDRSTSATHTFKVMYGN